MNNDDKKRRERWLIEEARRRSNCFPSAALTESESPDWLLKDACLGIEVSELLRPKGANLFSGSQLSSFQSSVVAEARERYFEQYSDDADVLVYFRNEWNKKKDRQSYAQSLARFVRDNLPSGDDSVTLSQGHARDWIEGIAVVRISSRGRKWQAGGSADGQFLQYADVANRIAAKNEKLVQYRQKLLGWGMWLLLATEIRVLQSVSIPPDISNWRFKFDFDRVLLMPWDGTVVDLQK